MNYWLLKSEPSTWSWSDQVKVKQTMWEGVRNYQARNNLIGKIYDTTTLILGMNPVRHQYKVMGLAPYVSEFHKKKPREIFLNSLTVNGLEFKKNHDVKDYFFYFCLCCCI